VIFAVDVPTVKAEELVPADRNRGGDHYRYAQMRRHGICQPPNFFGCRRHTFL